MTASKRVEYQTLVQLRKQCRDCPGLVNPSRYDYDSAQIGPWSRWQGNLDAELMVVGQDWGTTKFFVKWEGNDPPAGNPTNDNLRRLLNSIGIDIGPPGVDQEGQIFLTNVILCLKEGTLQAPVDEQWAPRCGEKFLRPLIEIVEPKVVVALGQQSYKAILGAYAMDYGRPKTYRMVVESGYRTLPDGVLLFPVYHCGAFGVNINREMSEQLEDWARVRAALPTR